MYEIRRVAIPEYMPGFCRLCGGSTDRQYWVDMGYVEEFYGHVYYCDVCMGGICRTAGYVSESYLHELESQIEALKQKDDGIYERIYDLLFGSGLAPFDLLELLDREAARELKARASASVQSGESRDSEPSNGGRSTDVPSASTVQFSLNFGDAS